MKPYEIAAGDFSSSAYKTQLFNGLEAHGAILVRQAFDGTVKGFEQCAAVIPNPISYRGGDSLREELGKKTYTASHYPEFMSLPLHHERSYCDDVPALIAFGGIVKAEQDGQTPICDGMAMLEDLPADLVSRIKEKGLKYIRRLDAEDNAFFRGWKNTFGTDDREKAISLSEVGGNRSTWKGDVLEVTNHRSGIINHPRSGKEVWINQITSYHPSVAEYVLRITPEAYLAGSGMSLENSPEIQTDCLLGDGSPLSREDLLAIWDAYDKHTFLADLGKGDLMLLDNHWIGHGRRPFVGDRLVCVSMGNY